MMQDLLQTAPFWILGFGGILLLVIDVIAKKNFPRAGFTSVLLLASLSWFFIFQGSHAIGQSSFKGIVYTDPFFVFSSLFILFTSLMVVFINFDRTEEEYVESPAEFYALLLMASAGAILFCNARELISLFIGLEIMSMALYCLCGSAISKRESCESALKYFLLGSFSSAFLLFGISLMYGITGSLFIPEIAAHIATVDSSILMLALGFLLVGLTFKIGAVPFHFWAPDVYQGAPTSITAYMATVIKASAVFALMRVLWGIFPDHIQHWSKFIWMLSLMTIIAGNLMALRQRNVKRMLAYSSIAHAGYSLAAFLVPNPMLGGGGGAAIIFYLVTYSAMTIGAFAILSTLKTPNGSFSFDISSLYGLSKAHPVLSLCLALFMFTLAGLPPGIGGLMGKFFIFSAVVSAGYVGLAIVAMIGSTVSCYYYLRVIVAMYFMPANSEDVVQGVSVLQRGVILIAALLCITLGLFPSELYAVAKQVVIFK